MSVPWNLALSLLIGVWLMFTPLVFALSVVSIPMLMDRETDAVAAPAELPAWPVARSAYVLIDDHWQALPTNNGRPVNSANARLSKLTNKDRSATKVAQQ